MVLCKFFQQGNCRFGSKCVNEHFDVKQVIKTDVEAAINGKQWPLSTYGPFKDKPSIPNFIEDQSFEEVRMLCYEAKQKNFFDQFHQQFNKEALEASNKMKALLQMTPEIIDVAISVYDMASDTSCSGATAAKTSNNNTNNPFGMTNAASTNAGSIFAKSNTNTSNNLFGNSGGFAASNQSTNNLFGQTSGFPTQQQQPQQQNSIFGQASKPANSIFGGGTNTNAQQKPSIFGQQQAQANIFANTGQQQQQTSTGIFGQQNQFAPQQNQPNANIFRQAAQPPQGLFAQAAQTMPPQQPPQQQGLFAQAAQQTMGQVAAPGQGLFAQAAQQTQNIFGQAMQQQQQQQQPPQMMPPPPMMGGQQQQFVPPGWPSQQPGMQVPPPNTSMPGSMPAPPQQAAPPTQSNIMNGNYQQQLTQSMGAMTMNPMKQPPPTQQQQQSLAGPPTSFNNANMGMPPQMPSTGQPLANGPPSAQQGTAPPTANVNNNFNPYPNGTSSRPPTAGTPGMPPPPTSAGPQQQQTQPPTSMAGNLPPAQNIPGAANQMTVNSASLPGMPHMPPAPQKSGQSTPSMPPMPGQQQPPQQQQPMQGFPGTQAPPSQFPPQSQTGRPGMMPPPMMGGQQHPAPMQQPGLPPMPGQQQQQQQPGMPPMQQPGMPPMPSQQQRGMPPMPGQQQQQQPGMPPMPGQQQQQPGMPPMQQPGMPPMPGYPPQPGQQPAMPGYPPQPGQAPMPGGYPSQMMRPQPGQPMTGRPGYNQPPGGMYQQPQQYEQQQKRLDPDQMPNPIQVMIENQRNAGGAFVTNQPGLLPPLVTTKYVVQDQGNSSPRFLRSSLYCVPATADLLKTTALPFSLIVSPYARIAEGEYEPPIVDFGALGPIRCNRCKAYMSPNMQFVDAGRRFQCLMCKVSTEVPTEYFQHLDHTGQRVDKYERPELVLGTYEFLATKDYCRNNTPPEIPAFIFVIDVSYNTVKSGLVHLLCSQVKQILKNLPCDQGQEKSKMRVGFITYNSTVHFYNIKSSLAQPQMMVVGDVQDMFMPLLDGFLCNPEESEAVIDALMEQIPKMFVDTKETETILYPAIQAGLEALKASNCSGKLLVFNSSLPIAEAPGKLKNRDDRKLLGTDKEKTVLVPQCQSYNQLGHECVQNGCSVDLFLFNNSYIDIATIGQVARLTGGEVYKYTYFQADIDGKRLIADIIKNVSRPIAFDAVMRVRTSAGVRATDFYGHFFMTNTTDVELASVDCDKSIAIEIKHDDKLPPEENVYLQIALLFTSCGGQRRLRILNIALKATTTIAEVFKSCDLDAIMLFFAKQSCFKLMELTPKAIKDTLIHRSAQILACYRKHCTTPSSAGQLILPECLKLLPLYISCLLKNDAISGGSDMTLDDRSYVIQFILSMDLNMFVSYLYPRFLPIHNVDPDDNELPMSMRCTHEKMSEDGAYILENGVHFFVWLGQSLPQTFIQPLFGVQCTQQVNAERFAITGDTPLAQRIRGIIEKVMTERTRHMRVTCVRQNDKLESVFRHFLIEDRGTDGSASYVDFLCHMHKEIKELLS